MRHVELATDEDIAAMGAGLSVTGRLAERLAEAARESQAEEQEQVPSLTKPRRLE
jgi:hypothetical protein